jgi:hypothetical protein
METAVISKTKKPMAKAIDNAVVGKEGCHAAVKRKLLAAKCSGCAIKHRQCGGFGMPKVLGCCDKGFSCIKKDDSFMMCRRNGGYVSSFWSGEKVPCDR